MNKYRDRLQIIADILSIADRKAKKTQIMYQANLSYRLLCRYLNEVLSAGLICREGEQRYVLTSKGKEFLAKHGQYSERCKSLEEHRNNVNNDRTILEKMSLRTSNPQVGVSSTRRKSRYGT